MRGRAYFRPLTFDPNNSLSRTPPMTHDEGSLADFLVDAVEPRVGNAASFGYGGYSSGSVPSGLARSSR